MQPRRWTLCGYDEKAKKKKKKFVECSDVIHVLVHISDFDIEC